MATRAGLAPGGWPHTLMAWPAVWSVPLGFLTMVLVSLATPAGSRPAPRRSSPGSTSRRRYPGPPRPGEPPGPPPGLPPGLPPGHAPMSGIALAAAAAAGAVLLAAGFVLGRFAARRGGRDADPDLGTPVERATFHTLHTASLAAPPLRAGLTEETARRAARTLRSLLGTEALCLTDRGAVLAWDGPGETTTARTSPPRPPRPWRPAAAAPPTPAAPTRRARCAGR